MRITQNLPSHADPRIIGEVLVADDGELFLVGGAHSPLEFALGLRKVSQASFKNFEFNLRRRIAFCNDIGASYLHLVAPDKQSVLHESFAIPQARSLGRLYANQTKVDFCFPVEDLRSYKSDPVYEATDTHFNAQGAGVIATLLAKKFGLPEAEIGLGEALLKDTLLPRALPFVGDLGRKLDPPRSNLGMVRTREFPAQHFASTAEGNTGTLRLAVARRAMPRRRLLIFGDSFLQVCLKELTAYFSEVLLCRSAFLHQEILLAFRPDYVVTQNAERYLSVVRSDEEAPPFLLYPQITGRAQSCRPEDAQALAAVLSYRSNLYPRFRAKFESEYGLAGFDLSASERLDS